ncbi:MAG: efflux RND transporter periplasmic adaptor subunit [Chloroflexi bacterium]|nr:efflux RND transporter periplasmic adaptor subunit [Chloroflexota bacterium]
MKKFLWAIFLLILALALVAGGFVAAVGSPQEAWSRVRALLPGNSQTAATQRGTATFGPNSQAGTQATQNGATAPFAAGDGADAAARFANLTPEQLEAMTTQIRAAADVTGQVSAAGNIQLASKQFVVLETDGIVQELPVRVGDDVAAGDLLAALNPADAEKAVERALLSLASAQLSLEKLYDETDPADIASAAADLESVQENLADLLNGPNQRELAASQANASAAWAKYNDLLAGPSNAELTQLSTNMRKMEVALAEARRDYEKVSWRPDVGQTPQSAAMEKATIDYENAAAAYDESTAPASTSDVQSALSQAQSAQKQLDDLLDGASAAEIAAAAAQVASKEATLADLRAGPDANALETAQIAVDKAFLDLEDAAAALAATRPLAPVDGTILAVNLTVGQRVGSGSSAVTLARRDNLELQVNVAEVDVSKLSLGQPAQITLDALPGENFAGEVISIAPAAESASGVVNYPVTIRLINPDSRVLSGMTSVAVLVNEAAGAGWLVPATAVRGAGDGTQVLVLRDGAPTPVAVTVGARQGEWVVVDSPELQADDRVVGTTASFINQENQVRFGPPGAGQSGGGVFGRPPGGGQP